MINHLRKILMIALAVIILVGGTGITAHPAQAASCVYYHTVSGGESLSWIGRYYGVNWLYLAQINNIAPPKYTIYPGQVLCIAYGGNQPVPPVVNKTWTFSVVKVEKNTTVRIRTSSFPDNVLFQVSIGKLSGNTYQWVKVADLDSDEGGAFGKTFDIPAQFAGTNQLIIRLTQSKKNISVDRWFSNTTSGTGTGGLVPGSYSGIPTFSIVSVVRNSTVTIRTRNFPPNLKFDVLMGSMGTRGINGYYVGTINSGSGGALTATFSIPAELVNHSRIAIRTQNLATGYYSFNWFYNNTAY